MLKYVLRRIFQMIPTVVGVVLVTFSLFNIVPNDLAAIALGKNVTLDMLEDFDAQRGLDKPLFLGPAPRPALTKRPTFPLKQGAGVTEVMRSGLPSPPR